MRLCRISRMCVTGLGTHVAKPAGSSYRHYLMLSLWGLVGICANSARIAGLVSDLRMMRPGGLRDGGGMWDEWRCHVSHERDPPIPKFRPGIVVARALMDAIVVWRMVLAAPAQLPPVVATRRTLLSRER